MSIIDKFKALNPFKTPAERAGILNDNEASTKFNTNRLSAAKAEANISIFDTIKSGIMEIRRKLYNAFTAPIRHVSDITNETAKTIASILSAPIKAIGKPLRYFGDILRVPPRVAIIASDYLAEGMGRITTTGGKIEKTVHEGLDNINAKVQKWAAPMEKESEAAA